MTDKELREMGVEDAYVRKDILEALKKEKADNDGLQKAYEEVVAELEAVKKQGAVEKAILEAGGRHVKAILALIDMEQVSFDEKKGTGMTKASQKKKEDDIRAAFWGLK